ncbi:MAG: 23S rRNA (uracil(1939)-C(5))-methyltransferase RlmD [Solobacterium sp.]|nr:23S rRNA (uracil(1939)-C(5))-methyltransferase RlmD [Solobacterium sp.]MCI7732176.1 23S rRNA (uracil(1939)-C(5))-methyltransferase RlmD [Solobacterium sp.]MDD6835359.1 23S rRNA (uracil(1939)-C(5))-methyltransferase RlmD [Solobacterium sp.]MDD6955748.1 23S rRNA (uracil(1939)-C(5))-methyltransferase RlmD [Solobacterium sp.]MDY4640388.1 23S rRNA (uracil(1939)-C(5))-methyltransferase RlmD [Erysipelotrichaceae bacterium]
MRLEIKKMGINGEGIGYDHGVPVFIPGALMHETVDVKITQEKEKYKTAKLIRVIRKSKDRVEPECRYCDSCRACTLMHLKYERQLNYKKQTLKQALKKYADIDMPVSIIKNDNIYHYRNKFKLPFGMEKGKIVTGMYESERGRFVPIEDCIIHEEVLEKVRKQILEIMNKYKLKAYNERTREGYRSLIMRTFNNKIALVFVVGDNTDLEPMLSDLTRIEEVSSIYYSVNTNKKYINALENDLVHVFGKNCLNARINDLKLVFTPKSFFQLNTRQAEVLYDEAVSLIDENDEEVLEAYCGVGVMSLMAARKAKHVTGVEIVPDAIDNAKKNARYNKIDNVDFVVGDSGSVMEEISKEKQLDCLIVDPPRTGLDEKMINSILNSNAKKLIYVSCNPSTLAKNLNVLKEYYNIESIRAIDVFSNTEHVESIVYLARM